MLVVMSMSERRRSARSTTPRAAQLSHRDHWTPVVVSNLSHHGARLCGTGSFKVGDRVVLELAASVDRVALAGRVVWNDHSRRRQAGVEFDALCEGEQTALDGLLFEAAAHVAERGDVVEPMHPARRR